MKVTLTIAGKSMEADLSRPLDISIPYLHHGRLRAWYLGPVEITPVRDGNWTGEVDSGAPVNFRNIYFNPHAHGTHTENVGHIAPGQISINNSLTRFHYRAAVISVNPEPVNDDLVITGNVLESAFNLMSLPGNIEALVVRTLPNPVTKKETDYCRKNPPYFSAEAMQLIRTSGINHLLTDLPSVDREEDGGRLAAHRTFWEYPEEPDTSRTITEFIYVADQISDGLYLLELQVAPFVNDASPSRPLLYELTDPAIKNVRRHDA